MLKKTVVTLVSLLASMLFTMSLAFAEVEVNKADQAALDGIKGIGPATSKIILDERKKGGNFKDWSDFETRVKGVGEKKAVALSEAGLTVNGAKKGPTLVPTPSKAEAKKDAKATAAEPAKK